MAGNSCSKSHRLNASSSFLSLRGSTTTPRRHPPRARSSPLARSSHWGRAYGINTRPRREFAFEHIRDDVRARSTARARRRRRADRPMSTPRGAPIANDAEERRGAHEDASRRRFFTGDARAIGCGTRVVFSMGTKAKTTQATGRPSFCGQVEK